MTRRYSFTYAQLWAIITGAVLLSAFCSGMLRGWVSRATPTPAITPAAPPVSDAADPMRECLDHGGVQLVYINGTWACVTADQAG